MRGEPGELKHLTGFPLSAFGFIPMNAFETIYLQSLATHGEFKAPTPALCERAFHWLADIWLTENPHQLLDAFGDWIEDEGLYTTETLQNVRGWACAVRFWMDFIAADVAFLRLRDDMIFTQNRPFRIPRTVHNGDESIDYDEDVYYVRRFLIANRRWIVPLRFSPQVYCSRHNQLRSQADLAQHNIDLMTAAIRLATTQHMRRHVPFPTFSMIVSGEVEFHLHAQKELQAMTRAAIDTLCWSDVRRPRHSVIFDETHIIDGIDF